MVIEQNQVEKYFDYSDSRTSVYLYNWVATETLATKLTYNCYFSRYNCYRFILQIWVLPGWVVYVYHGQCLFTVAPCETSRNIQKATPTVTRLAPPTVKSSSIFYSIRPAT